MAELHRRGAMLPFYFKWFVIGHRLTNFTKWDDADAPYTTQYEDQCEPYFISHWDTMPWCVRAGVGRVLGGGDKVCPRAAKQWQGGVSRAAR